MKSRNLLIASVAITIYTALIVALSVVLTATWENTSEFEVRFAPGTLKPAANSTTTMFMKCDGGMGFAFDVPW